MKVRILAQRKAKDNHFRIRYIDMKIAMSMGIARVCVPTLLYHAFKCMSLNLIKCRDHMRGLSFFVYDQAAARE